MYNFTTAEAAVATVVSLHAMEFVRLQSAAEPRRAVHESLAHQSAQKGFSVSVAMREGCWALGRVRRQPRQSSTVARVRSACSSRSILGQMGDSVKSAHRRGNQRGWTPQSLSLSRARVPAFEVARFVGRRASKAACHRLEKGFERRKMGPPSGISAFYVLDKRRFTCRGGV